MPVTKRQFELGVTPECEEVMKSAYRFLYEQADYAFTLKEIVDGVLREQPPLQVELHLERSLEILVGLLAVDRRKLDHGTGVDYYYAFLQEFDTGTWRSLRGVAPSPPSAPSIADR